MPLAIKIGERKIRRLHRLPDGVACACRLTKKPNGVSVIVHGGLIELPGQRCKVKLCAVSPNEVCFASGWNRHADLTQTHALRFEFPACGSAQIVEGEPQVVPLGRGTYDRHRTIAVNDRD